MEQRRLTPDVDAVQAWDAFLADWLARHGIDQAAWEDACAAVQAELDERETP